MHLRSCCPSFTVRTGIVLVIILTAFFAGFAELSASEAIKRSFRLEAGDAVATLRQFATQASEQVLFPPEAVRGVTTRAVRGDYTPKEALQMMTAGTALVVIQDEKSGALSVKRNDDTAGKNGEGRPADDRAAYIGGDQSQRATGDITGRIKNLATGAYLNNARVSVPGTQLLVFTDDTGTYVIKGVPAGVVSLAIFYTGLDPQAVTVQVGAGETVERNVDLTSATRYGSATSVVELDSFVVASARETDSESLAINEQRFAPNIKNVVSTETLGDPLGGSMGDFLRFLPGVSAAYGALETEGVLIRGFPSNMSVVSMDGVQMAGANLSGGRDFTPSRVGVNSVSRVEVTKVPLPSSAADTMSGSINLVSKSAFERSKAELRYRIGISSNEQTFALKKTPSPFNKKTYKVYPDLNFDYTLPISKNLGLVVTGLHSTSSFQTDTWYTDYRASATGVPTVTSENPYLQRLRNVQIFRAYERKSLSLKLDWRPSKHSVLSFTGLVTKYHQDNSNDQFNPTVGTNGTSSIATGGTTLQYTNTSVIGATGRGAMPQAFSYLESDSLNQAANIRYRFDDGTWRITSSINASTSTATRRDVDEGFFNALGVAMRVPVRVSLLDVNNGRVGDFKIYDNSNNAIDPFDINNYVLSTATNQPKTDIRATISAADLDVRRQINVLPFPAAVQVGGLHRIQTNDDRRVNGRAYTYNGINGDRSAAPYFADSFYGYRKLASYPDKPYVPWVSPYKVWEAFQANPALFSQTLAQERTTISNNIINSKYIEESVSAGYVQLEGRFLRNRLNVVTGVRYERTTDKGEGPYQDPNAVYVRNADGTFARTSPTGPRIRKPEAGGAGSLQEVALIYQERGAKAERQYDGYYPSLHLNYNATPNLMLRAAYAKTYGRPNFANIIPNTTVDQDDDLEADPDRRRGRLNYSNIGLKPWTADNYDLSLEYYTDQGGVISGGVFLKEVRDFFGTIVKDVTAEDLEALGLDDRYLGWRVTTQFNSGSARVQGAEVNLRHSLVPFGKWGKHVIVFANATKLKLEGHDLADFTGFLPESVNWGFTVAVRRFTFISKWNYRGEQKAVSYPEMGPNAFRFPQPRVQLDLSLDYQVTRRVSLYLNVRNVTNEIQEEGAYGPETPAHAREFYHGQFGRVFTLGVKGVF